MDESPKEKNEAPISSEQIDAVNAPISKQETDQSTVDVPPPAPEIIVVSHPEPVIETPTPTEIVRPE